MWNPDANRGATDGDRHFNTAQATVIVGSQIPFRLCAACAALPAFKDKRKRVPIVRRDHTRTAADSTNTVHGGEQ